MLPETGGKERVRNMAEKYFEEIMNQCTQEIFLDGVRERYHYPVTERDLLYKVACEMQEPMLEEAVWEHRVVRQRSAFGEAYAMVAMTLGAGVDALQDRYLRKGLLTESYMIEVLSSEILLHGYEAYNRRVADHTGYHVRRFYFLNEPPQDTGETQTADAPDLEPAQNAGEEKTMDEPNLTLHDLPEILRALQLPISCNEAYCMTPRKSVAFYAALDRETEANCPGICMDCTSADCPNRLMAESGKSWNFADMADRPLPYGYARIFGQRNA